MSQRRQQGQNTSSERERLGKKSRTGAAALRDAEKQQVRGDRAKKSYDKHSLIWERNPSKHKNAYLSAKKKLLAKVVNSRYLQHNIKKGCKV